MVYQESVSKMLGHTNIQNAKHYAKILDIKVGADITLIKEKYTVITYISINFNNSFRSLWGIFSCSLLSKIVNR